MQLFDLVVLALHVAARLFKFSLQVVILLLHLCDSLDHLLIESLLFLKAAHHSLPPIREQLVLLVLAQCVQYAACLLAPFEFAFE